MLDLIEKMFPCHHLSKMPKSDHNKKKSCQNTKYHQVLEKQDASKIKLISQIINPTTNNILYVFMVSLIQCVDTQKTSLL